MEAVLGARADRVDDSRRPELVVQHAPGRRDARPDRRAAAAVFRGLSQFARGLSQFSSRRGTDQRLVWDCPLWRCRRSNPRRPSPIRERTKRTSSPMGSPIASPGCLLATCSQQRKPCRARDGGQLRLLLQSLYRLGTRTSSQRANAGQKDRKGIAMGRGHRNGRLRQGGKAVAGSKPNVNDHQGRPAKVK